MTADNTYRKLDATVHSQYGNVLNESNLQILRMFKRCSSYVFIYSYRILSQPSALIR